MGNMGWFDQSHEFQKLKRELFHMERRLTYRMWKLKENAGMAQVDLDRLTAAVAKNTTVSESAVTMIEGLAQQIRDAADDPQELNALADELESKAGALADAISANTPTPPAPPVVVDPPVVE